ncbi:MAG: alpha/beta hydrolase family protein [Candidatus Cyclobacteriaceae bacterium M3_2C_046]
MRVFEIILLLVATILPFVKRPFVRQTGSNFLLLFLGILIVVHLIIEGWRWQMFPGYLLIIILAWRIKVVDVSDFIRLSFLRLIGFVGIAMLALLGWTLPVIFPVFSLPETRGPYHVGTQQIYIPTGKEEKITKDPNDRRELMCKIWYPGEADISAMEGERYIEESGRSGFATKYGLPPATFNYLDLVETYAFPDITVAEGHFPVLIFSHGYGSKATGYYALLTEIASQGYVIINMNHTYESLGVTFPDGSKKYFDYDYQQKISSGSMEVVKPVIEAFRNGLDYEKRHPIVRQAVKNYFEGGIEDRWAEDMLAVINLLEKWNNEGWLKNKLDLDKIGVFGHSVGGGSAGKLAMKDQRVKAAANLDGIQWGNQIDSLYHVPYLYISADWPAEHEDINAHVYINKSTDYFYESRLLNSGHSNFMDIPFMIPVRSIAGTGDINPYLGIEIVTKLITSFFDRHLKNVPDASLEKIDAQYELLEVVVYQGDSIK